MKCREEEEEQIVNWNSGTRNLHSVHNEGEALPGYQRSRQIPEPRYSTIYISLLLSNRSDSLNVAYAHNNRGTDHNIL